MRFMPCVLLALALGGSAEAQLVRIGIGGGNKTTVVLVNDAWGDHSVLVSANGHPAALLGPGERNTLRIGSWLLAGSAEVDLLFQACEAVEDIPFGSPAWATDTARFGEFALPGVIDPRKMSERDLERRVRGIRRALEREKVLGRREMLRELDAWERQARELGAQPIQRCVNPRVVGTRKVVAWGGYGYSSQRTNTFVVRGPDRRGDYRID